MNRNLYVYTKGRLVRKNNTMRFIEEGGDKHDIPVEQVSDIYIMTQMDFNTEFLNLASHSGIALHFYNYYDFYIGSYYPKEKFVSGFLLTKQVEFYSDYEKRVDLARRIIKSASYNIYRNLRYYNGRGRNLSNAMEQITSLRKKLDSCATIQEIMAIEGNIRHVYYRQWNEIVNQDIDFEKRVMHPPDNYINSLISYVNSIIYTRVLSEIYKTQLNPTISYLHEPGERRFSLCLDLSEIFKPLIGDRLIFSLLNKKQITKESFTPELNGMHLTKKASQTIMKEMDLRLQKTIHHKVLDRNVTYEYLIRLEAYKLVKHLLGEKEYEGFEIWW